MLAATALEPAVEDEIGASVFVEQRFRVRNERWIVGGIPNQERVALGLGEVERLVKERLESRPAFGLHDHASIGVSILT